MSSSSWQVVLGVAVVLGVHAQAHAQQQTQGFAVERFYASASGGGWFVMDDLNLHGGLGGAFEMTLGYASNPLRVTDGMSQLAVVSNQAFVDFGAALTYDRWRFYLNVASPLVIRGQSGTVGDYSFTGPSVDFGSNPDTLSDVRLGMDVRIAGKPDGPFRFGVGSQLYTPSGTGTRSEYITDGTFRGMVRALVAGDAPFFTYAAQLGAHIRPLDDSPIPGSPNGSELLFGVAAGAKLPFGRSRSWVAIVGPEVYGATAFRAFFDSTGTALEGLLSGRIEGTRDDKLQVRVKLGIGGGIHPNFGAAEWRIVAGVEIFNHGQRATPVAPSH